MAKGRFTFPVAILICLLLRIITGNEWQDVINLLVCALTAYLLIEINTAFTLIRTRSTLHVSFYVFLSTACLFLHSFQYAVFAPLTFLIAISQLFSSYESPYPAGSIFHAFFFIGLGSLLFPQLLYFVPLFYLGMISFRSLSLKSFFAGLTGLCALLSLFRLCVLLRQNESLLSPFTGAYSFSTHQLWDIRDGQNHILWNHHLDITGQQRALFPCFLFRQGTHAYIPFFPDRR